MPFNSPKGPPYWNSTLVSISTTSPQSTCHSAPVSEILCYATNRMSNEKNERTRIRPYENGNMHSHFDTIHKRDRHLDGRADRHVAMTGGAMHSVARQKKTRTPTTRISHKKERRYCVEHRIIPGRSARNSLLANES